MSDATFGTVLSQLRKKSAMTQKDLSRKLNVHITTIKNWENDNCCPDAKNICALANIFHVTTDYLFNREGNDIISLEGLTIAERKQLINIVQAYMDTLPRKSKDLKGR